MDNLFEQAKNLISLNRLIDSQILLLSLLNSKDITNETKEKCLNGLLEIAEKLGKEKDIEKYNASLALIYFEQKKYRNFLNIYNQDIKDINSNYILKLIMISFLEEGEINNFRLVLNRLMGLLEENKLFHAAEFIVATLEKSMRQGEIDEYIAPFLLQKGDDKKIAEILNRSYEKYKSGVISLQSAFKKNILDWDKYYKKKVAPESFYVLYLENYLNTELKTERLRLDQYLKILKMFFDGHIYYPDSFEITKRGLQIALLSNDKKLAQSLLNVIDRKFKNLKKSQHDYIKLKKQEIKKIDEDGVKLEKKLLTAELPSPEEKNLEVESSHNIGIINDKIAFLKSRGSKRPSGYPVIPSGVLLENINSENYGDIFCIFHSLEEYEICQKVISIAFAVVHENGTRSKKLQFKDKINIEYLKIENFISMGLYRQAIQASDQIISSMPLDLEDKITFWYLAAEAQFQLKEFKVALPLFNMILNQLGNYRLVKVRISQIEQAE